jgi:hypothetical protein
MGVMGFPIVASALSFGFATLGVGMFTILSAVDTHAMIASYQQGKLDSVGHGMELALDFANLLLDYIRILLELLRSASDL